MILLCELLHLARLGDECDVRRVTTGDAAVNEHRRVVTTGRVRDRRAGLGRKAVKDGLERRLLGTAPLGDDLEVLSLEALTARVRSTAVALAVTTAGGDGGREYCDERDAHLSCVAHQPLSFPRE